MNFIMRHFGVFFWLCWLLLAVAAGLEGMLALPEWMCGVAILLLNGISWPVAVAYYRAVRSGWYSNRLVRKAVMGQVVATMVLPFLYFAGS